MDSLSKDLNQRKYSTQRAFQTECAVGTKALRRKPTWQVQGSRKKVTVEFRKPWEHDLKQMELVKGRNPNTEFGLYSERSKKLLEDFTEG